MQKVKISKYELFTLIILMQIGTTTLWVLGIEAKQNAWLVTILAFLLGAMILWLYMSIQKYYPHKNLIEILMASLGKWIAIPLGLLYALYFFYTSSFNLYETSSLIVSTFLVETPLNLIIIIIMLSILYGIYLGIEVIGRTSLLMMPVYIFFLLLVIGLAIISGVVDIQKLQPVMNEGFVPIVKAIPSALTFPFGEIIVFFMYWKFIGDINIVRKSSFRGYLLAGILIITTQIITLSTLGVYQAKTATVPFFEVIELVNIGGFIQRLDSLGIIFLFIGGYFKTILFFEASVLSVKSLFKKLQNKWLVAVMALFLVVFINLFFENFIFYQDAGKINTQYTLPLFEVFLPVLILLLIMVKTKKETLKGNR